MTDRRTAEAHVGRPEARLEGSPDVSRAFEPFYRTHVAAVTALAYTLAGNWHVAEDLAQEAFARALRDWDNVGRLQRPDSWVRTTTANLATSRFRRLRTEARALVRMRTVEQAAPDPLPDDLEAFWAAVRSLPRRQAHAVALRYAGDMAIADIAERMGCAEGTIKATLHRARSALSARLDEARGPHER